MASEINLLYLTFLGFVAKCYYCYMMPQIVKLNYHKLDLKVHLAKQVFLEGQRSSRLVVVVQLTVICV